MVVDWGRYLDPYKKMLNITFGLPDITVV